MAEAERPAQPILSYGLLIGFALWWITQLTFTSFDVGRPSDSELEQVDARVTDLDRGWQTRDEAEPSTVEYVFTDHLGTRRVGQATLHVAEGQSLRVAYLRADPERNFAIEAESRRKRESLTFVLALGAVGGWCAWTLRRTQARGRAPMPPLSGFELTRVTLLGLASAAVALRFIPPGNWPLPHLGAAVTCLLFASLLATAAIAAVRRHLKAAAVCALSAAWLASCLFFESGQWQALSSDGLVSSLVALFGTSAAAFELSLRPTTTAKIDT